MTIRTNQLIITILLLYWQNVAYAQTETKKAPTPIYYGTDLIAPTLFLNNGLLYDTSFIFGDTIAFDKTARVFIMHEGRVFGATQPILNFYNWEAIRPETILKCQFDYPRLPLGDYTLVIPAGTIWWKSDPSIKNDIIERPICIPDRLHAIQTSPNGGDTVTTLQKFSVMFHCDVTEKSDPVVTLYKEDVTIGTFPMTVINDYGSFNTAKQISGKPYTSRKASNTALSSKRTLSHQNRNMSLPICPTKRSASTSWEGNENLRHKPYTVYPNPDREAKFLCPRHKLKAI